jgi:hypothetical protein
MCGRLVLFYRRRYGAVLVFVPGAGPTADAAAMHTSNTSRSDAGPLLARHPARILLYKVQQFRCYRRGLTMYTAVGVC